MAVVTGVNAIETSFVTEFASTVQLLLQREGSLLRDTVMVGSHRGKDAVPVEQMGKRTAQKRTTRHGDSPLNPQSFDRRWVYPVDYEDGDLVDDQDKLRMLVDPTSPITKGIAYALGRAIDDEIIAALGGTAKTGATGSTSVALTNTIANGGTGLTIAKLREALQKLETGDVRPEREMITLVLSPIGKQQLLATTEVTSSDYNTVKALVQGQIDTFMGFKFKTHTGLVVASNIRSCYAYAESGMHLGLWDDIMIQVAPRPDKGFTPYAYGRMTCGATRLEEAKVVKIDIDETA